MLLLAQIRHKYFSDIRFWILVFFAVRLFSITQPPLEISHNWRQVTGNMITRNFLEVNNNILYPMLDNGGATNGITGTEFPLLNYIGYLLSLIFGFNHWWGRLINLTVSSFGIFYFFLLVKKFFGQKIAFYSAISLLCSAWFLFMRKAMPDTFSTSLLLIGIYFGILFLYESKLKFLFVSSIFVLAGTLSKIPAAVLLAVFFLPYLYKEIKLKNKIILAISLTMVMIPVAWWYYYWVPHLFTLSGFHHYYMGVSLGTGANELLVFWTDAAKNFYFHAAYFSGFLLFVAGIFFSIKDKNKMIGLVTLVCSISFFLLMLKGGRTFALHSYYMIPFIPVMALNIGFALSRIPFRWSRFLFAFLIIENIANQQHDLFTKDSEVYKLKLEQIADKVSQKNNLVAINGTMSPQEIYFTHRKGWTIFDDEATRRSFTDSLQQLGCIYLFIDKHSLSVPISYYPKVFDDEDFSVYRLAP
ncbi:MAG: ArnT family glycosyltransferase [Bacteroidia bacterium]